MASESSDSSSAQPPLRQTASPAESTDGASSAAGDGAAPEQAPPLDRRLGDFRLLRQLGSGGMAEVYLAEQISLGRMVAVKILQQDAVSGKNDTLLKRFEQEARAAGGLSDPNIVQVFMIGHEDDTHYIVQEYVQGLNLSQWFRKHGCPDFLHGLKWMRQVAAALKAASAAGVVHRDIKPENIMLTRAGDAKVTDFGLAQLNESNEKLNLTQQGTTMGTPWYMSPEQIQGEKLDHRCDQYSFGVTCYHMFAGQPPFPGKNSVSVAVKHLKEDARPLREHRQDLPEELCDVIHRMMSKSPEDRFATPDDLLQALDGLRNAPVNTSLAPPNDTWEWLQRSLPSVRFGLLGLIVCTFVGLAAGRNMQTPPRLAYKDVEYPEYPDATSQFGKAILDSSNPEAWIAVTRYYAKSDEAVWARIQLGVLFAQRRKDYQQAEEWFEKARDSSRNNRELEMLALIGQAWVARSSNDESTYEDICQKQLVDFHEELREYSIPVPDALLPTLVGVQEQVLPPDYES